MKYTLQLGALFFVLSGQLKAQHYREVEYINYNSVIGTIAEFVKMGDTVLWNKSIQSLSGSARSVKEETVFVLPKDDGKAGVIKPKRDEQIYSQRKNSVIVIGRLRRTGGTNINFEVMGTGFFISKTGLAVTNRHVLQDLFLEKQNETDLYFVITEDKRIYPFDKLVTYSLNNDLAVFNVVGDGRAFNAIPLGVPAVVGAPIYCISHPAGELYYFSKGIVARNLSRDSATLGTAYASGGRTPIRMEITADYGGGSSGGPVMDQSGNLVGIIATTNTIFLNDGTGGRHPQMVIKSAIPVKALRNLIR